MGNLLRKALIVSLSVGVLVSELGCDTEEGDPIENLEDLGELPGEGGGKFDELGTFRYVFSNEPVNIVLTDELAASDGPGLSVRANLWVHDPERDLPEHIAEQIDPPYPDAIVQTRAFGFYPYARQPVSFGVTPEDDDVHHRMLLQGNDGWLATFAEGRYGIDCITNDAQGLHLRAVTRDGEVHEGTATMDFLAEEGILDGNLKVRAIKLPDRFQDHGKPEQMYEDAGLNASGILATVLKALGRNDFGQADDADIAAVTKR